MPDGVMLGASAPSPHLRGGWQCLRGGLLAGSVHYCVQDAGIRASVGNARCELLFVPLAAALHCRTHAFVRIFRDIGFV